MSNTLDSNGTFSCGRFSLTVKVSRTKDCAMPSDTILDDVITFAESMMREDLVPRVSQLVGTGRLKDTKRSQARQVFEFGGADYIVHVTASITARASNLHEELTAILAHGLVELHVLPGLISQLVQEEKNFAPSDDNPFGIPIGLTFEPGGPILFDPGHVHTVPRDPADRPDLSRFGLGTNLSDILPNWPSLFQEVTDNFPFLNRPRTRGTATSIDEIVEAITRGDYAAADRLSDFQPAPTDDEPFSIMAFNPADYPPEYLSALYREFSSIREYPRKDKTNLNGTSLDEIAGATEAHQSWLDRDPNRGGPANPTSLMDVLVQLRQATGRPVPPRRDVDSAQDGCASDNVGLFETSNPRSAWIPFQRDVPTSNVD